MKTAKMKAKRSELLAKMRDYGNPSILKRASLGGDQEAGFEQSFASLAFTYIQDKAPALLDYMVGFQLVERNEDNTKAMGVFGFQIGNQWLYSPVFFLNGDLKGHELLYLRNQDMMVPLKENWVNKILSRKPQVLGEGTGESLQQLGVRQPNIHDLSTPPMGKASNRQPRLASWAKEAMPYIARLATVSPSKRHTKLAERLNLKNFLVDSGVEGLKLADRVSQEYPSLRLALSESLKQAALELKAKLSKPESVLSERSEISPKQAKRIFKTVLAAADNPPEVKVVTDQTITANISEMTTSEREKLLRDGYLVKDPRKGEEVSVAYNTQIECALTNPDSTDLYEVLVRPGGFERCLVVHCPHTNKKRLDFLVVINIESKDWENNYNTNVFVKQQDSGAGKSQRTQWKSWFDGLSNSDITKDGTYVIVTENGDGTAVFSARENLGDGCWRVSWQDYCYESRPDYLPRVTHYHGEPMPFPGDECIYFNERPGSRMRSVQGQLYVPNSAKVIKIADPPKCKCCDKVEDDCTCDYFKRDYSRGSDKRVLQTGNLDDLQMQLVQKTASIKIWHDHTEVVINDRRMSKLAGLIHLITGHGLREKQAVQMLKESERFGGKRYRIKYAYPYGDMGPYAAGEGMSAPAIPGAEYGMDPAYGGVQTMMPQEETMGVDAMSSGNTDPSVYDPMQMDPNSMQVAQQAQQTGQKEVFDTAMISSMLKAVRNDSLVDRYIGDLMKALDRLGRILFMFYWHAEEFADRYGKQDIPELEDTLRNAFEVLGDLVLFLKEKTIDSGMSNMLGEPDIEDVSRS